MQALNPLRLWEVQFQEKGKFYPNSGPKRRVWNIGRADCHSSQVPLPKASGKSPKVPYSGVALLPISLATLSTGGKAPSEAQCQLPPFSTSHLSPLWWQIDGLPRCLLHAPCDRGQQHWAHGIDFHVSLLAHACVGDFHPWPLLSLPYPAEELRPVGYPLCWINIKFCSVWYQVAAAPFLLGWGLYICVIFILCLFSWQMAYFSLLGWHGGRKGITLRACSAW